MTPIYLKVTQHEVMTQLAEELVDTGIVAKERIRAYSIHPQHDVSAPVEVIRYRSPSRAVVTGGVTGAFTGALVGLPFLSLGGLGMAPLLVLMVTGGVGGAVYRLWIGNGSRELCHFDEALKSGELVMVLEVDPQRVSIIQDKIKSTHPEVSILGADPEGTPPFP